MAKFKLVKKEELDKLPQTAGVYCFSQTHKTRSCTLLYIGKAVNIRQRVKNHFQQSTFKDNVFIPQTDKIGFIETNSEIEALLLEAQLIKQYLPKYNSAWKDDKTHSYVAITKENYPRIFIARQTQLQLTNSKKLITNNGRNRLLAIRSKPLVACIGPFVDSKALKHTLRFLRKVFPFRTCKTLPKKPCLYKELGLCPAPCLVSLKTKALKNGTTCARWRKLSQKKYQKNIKNLVLVLQGKKISVLQGFKKEMVLSAKEQEFEKAKELRDKIFALEKVFANAKILQKEKTLEKEMDRNKNSFLALQKILALKKKVVRIEGYDVSNIQGKQAVGSMIVFKNGLPDKSQYRKFKIKFKNTPDDIAMLKEVLSRRFKHQEWPLPQVILIDGGIAQFSAGLKIKNQISKIKNKEEGIYNFNKIKQIKIISLAKKNNELFVEGKPARNALPNSYAGGQKPLLLKNLTQDVANLILYVRDEAHRFAISYHKKLRSKNLLQ